VKAFVNPAFTQSILGMARAYGGLDFWIQNLYPGANPDAAWRALMVVGALKDPQFAALCRSQLDNADSRVRAWACFALGQLENEEAVERIYALNGDPASRVRIHAWQAIQAIVGPEESSRHFHLRLAPANSLILISEDSVHMQALLADLYQKMGFRVQVAATEAETLAQALALKPQAIVTDNQKLLDNLSGLNMTWDICRRPELRDTLIFMLTADLVEPIFLWNGGDFFLSKAEATVEDLTGLAIQYLRR
jgi:CheY-like chemotaxis protein